jgi:protein-S-isoprenylcysteine O-methyltransferase Ste14
MNMPPAIAPGLWISGFLWLVLLVYMFATAFQSRRTVREEPWWQWSARIVPLIVAYALLLRAPGRPDWLGRRVLPASALVVGVGIAVTAIGVALAIWARRHLGRNWSGTISTREGHELIRSGPYRWIRHPIYGGYLMATIGTAITIGEVRAMITVAVVFVVFLVNARLEEAWLAREFGADLELHRRQTGRFFPRIR